MITKNNKNELSNPYVSGAEGRKEWNDRTKMLSKSIWDWKKAFIGTLILAIILALGLIYVSSQSKIQPFAVEVNNGMPIAIKAMEPMSLNDKKTIYWAITNYIINAKTIVSDTEEEKNLLNKVYAYSANDSIKYIQDYFSLNNPFNAHDKYTTAVSITNAFPINKNTWQVDWQETKRSVMDGSVVNVSKWEANIKFEFGEVNKRFMVDNPWGLYITQISWSPSFNNN